MYKQVLISLALLAGAPLAAQAVKSPAPAAPAETHLVVFNRPGPAFARAQELREAAIAHQKLYRDFAAQGKIIAGGRMTGEPVLGLSVFAADVDKAQIRSALENDAAVKAGIVAIEFREWQLQMGSLAGAGGKASH